MTAMDADQTRIDRRIEEQRDRPEPVIHPEVAPFWSGVAEGELRVQVCSRCGTHRFPFAPVCHRCLAFDHTWQPIPRDGVVAAAVLVRRATGDPVWAAHVPFASGIVDVAYGLRLPGRILCECDEGLRRGARVQAVILTHSERPPIYAFAHDCIYGG